MDSSNNTAINILDKDNWSKALLVKDERGNFVRLQPQSGDNLTANQLGRFGMISEGNLAPKDANFASGQSFSGSSRDKAELVFHPDDKAELDLLASNVPQDDSKRYSIEKIVARIIEKQELEFDDKNKKIFTNILYNFFRSRKSAVITRELLSKNVLIKNKQLPGNIVDIVLSVVKSIKGRIDAEGGLVVNRADLQAQKDKLPKQAEESKPKIEEISQETKSDMGSDLSAQDEVQAVFKQSGLKTSVIDNQSAQEDKSAEQKQSKSTVYQESEPGAYSTDKEKQISHKPAAGFAIPVDQKETEVNRANNTAEPSSQDIAEAITSLPRVSRPGMSTTFKKSMADVVLPPKTAKEEMKDVYYDEESSMPLMGSIQELKSFDLIGFRRLGDSAEHRVQKILEKINLLEQESYTKKAQGISAWRNSGVYQLYLRLGAESMSEGKQVENYIKEKQDNNEETLSIAEFSAISDLNKQLRF